MANPRTIARLESRILERAAIVLQSEVADPRASFITVTRVKLSPDLSSGRIYYSVLGTEGDKSKAAHMLDSAAGFLQRQIALAVQLRRMPHLKWSYDDSLERADDMSRLIQQARGARPHDQPARRRGRRGRPRRERGSDRPAPRGRERRVADRKRGRGC
jgi:ribosome-binding factor A